MNAIVANTTAHINAREEQILAFRMIVLEEEHYTIFWNGFENGEKPKQGVGIAVRNTFLSCVEQPLFVSPRLMSIRMRTRAGYITVISAYAPTLLAYDEDKD